MPLFLAELQRGITRKRLVAFPQTQEILAQVKTRHRLAVVSESTARIDDLLWTLFGIYVDPNQKPECRTSISNLSPNAWSLASEDMRYQVGARHEHFIKQGDQQRKIFADEFLVRVNGQQYRAADVLAIELLDKLRSLMSAHNGMNNFYNEWPPAWRGETARLRESAAPHATAASRASRSGPRSTTAPRVACGTRMRLEPRRARPTTARDSTRAHLPPGRANAIY